MTDWDRVERLRAKGIDWKPIAEDRKTHLVPTNPRELHRTLLLLILAGLGLSLYATFEVLSPGLQNSCSVGSYFSCGAVVQSGQTSILGVPDWAIGVGGFALMLALDIPLLSSFDARLLRAVLGLSVVGLAVAIYLAYVEVALIGALCPVCLGTYVADLGVLACSWKLVALRTPRGTIDPDS